MYVEICVYIVGPKYRKARALDGHDESDGVQA